MTKRTPPSPIGQQAPGRTRSTRASLGRMRNAWLIIAIITVFLIGLILQVGWETFLDLLYRPVAIVIIVFLAIEYILIKGRDRSRIYRIELQQLREKRREDIEFIRNLEEDLEKMDETLAKLRMSLPSDAEDEMEHIRDIRERLDSVRSHLKDLL
ncbi:MAG: hypothetical protein ACOC2L_05615 [Candidatus Sumerlaeota bacterium]